MACPGATKDFETLRNTLAVQAALQGCFAGFQGRLLDVSLPLFRALHRPRPAASCNHCSPCNFVKVVKCVESSLTTHRTISCAEL